MTIYILNPNSTASMTEAMCQQARRAAPDLQFERWTSEAGPPAIQGRADGETATAPLLELVQQAAEAGAEGIIIGCFDDTALTEAAALASCPVIGIGQAAYHYAALRQWRFSVVTTLPVSVPILEENITRQGLHAALGRVRASDVPVLTLDADPGAATEAIRAEVLRALSEDQVEAIILGCAGMVHVVEALRRDITAEIIDPVACAARSFRWLI